MMKKMLYAFVIAGLMSVTATAQEPELFGTWINGEGHVLMLHLDDTFQRWSSDKELLASGTLEWDHEREFHVKRSQDGQEYYLHYYVGNETLVVEMPGDNRRAWLFRKIGN